MKRTPFTGVFSVIVLLAAAPDTAPASPSASAPVAAPLLCSAAGPAASPPFAQEGDRKAPVVTTASLLGEMTDLKGLSRFPDPPFTCRQFSSYDRKSIAPDKDWFANGDCGRFLREEKNNGRTESVMMDADGPGAIVRIWSANPKGTLRIYLDGSAEPVVEEKMTDYLSGKVAGMPFPIAHTASKGWNSYYPIPYAKHCKVTSDDKGFYYHVNYRTYPAGTAVRTFAAGDPERLEAKAVATAKTLADPRAIPLGPGEGEPDAGQKIDCRLAPGGNWKNDLSRAPSGWAVCAMELKVAAEDLPAALRGVLLRMSFDGITTVDAPLGDFFGSAPGLNPYASLPAGMDEDGSLWCRWWMPFRRSREISIENFSKETVGIKGKVYIAKSPFTEETMYFHAKWRIEKKIPTRPMKDWNFITAEGKGVFVGDALAVANPVKNWWGEGDEKIYVDGETFPSHFGTGSEDYFGYAWCCPELFNNAYHDQTRCDGPGNYGHTSVNRWHIPDRIPFTKKFRFDIEIWHWADVKVDYAAMSYWYAFPKSSDNFPPVGADPKDLVLDLLGPYKPHKVKGAIEGEAMKVLEKTGITERQGADSKYSGEAQLWWREAKPGDRLVLAFESEKAGPRHVFAVFTRAKDYGIHRLAVNGVLAGEPFDLYKSGPWGPTKETDLGVFDLKKGQNTLTVTIVGTNKDAKPSYMFGLDYIRLGD